MSIQCRLGTRPERAVPARVGNLLTVTHLLVMVCARTALPHVNVSRTPIHSVYDSSLYVGMY